MTTTRPALLWIGLLVVAAGVLGIVFGSMWGQQAEALLTGNSAMQFFELYVPYYPFVPFLPTFVIGLGAYLMVKSRG
jgi:hypothetical protein